ncbi:MAG TPA: HAD-IC family P-type ATPase [Acidimicrobiales bacterium]|nr:HAD-IC family P-type ATPase [Acidimicrobiales bacterium]
MQQTVDTTPVPRGLTDAEVADRIESGRVNRAPGGTSRSLWAIVRANVFTRFNAILGALLVIILTIGPLQDALFGVVLVTNTGIGIYQEWRAKRTLDRLSLLTAPAVTVARNGERREISLEDVVDGDVVELGQGTQIVADGEVLSADALEVDESLLSGESVPEAKSPGDEVLSGSFVSAGQGWYRADRIGAESYANQLSAEARRFSLVRSELRRGTDQILRLVTWLIIPTAILLIFSQLAESTDDSLGDAIRGTVAGVGSMIPEGLVLLTSIAFTAGVLRLGHRQVLVQELAAIEGLARVDIVCTDKTGTLTELGLEVADLHALDDADEADAESALGALAAADPEPNASMRALAERYPSPGWTPTWRAAFSSARRFSGSGFGDNGDWVIGAPNVLLEAAGGDGDGPEADGERDRAAELVDQETRKGRRVLLLARTEGEPRGDGAPAGHPVALVVIEERIRDNARSTLDYFASQDVTVKVVSGDDPRTVGAVAARVGLDNTASPRDARDLPDDPGELADVMERTNVFGRVGPQQKQAMVRALQARGHTVAMTGDGVNDVLALKEADLGVAMGTGAPVSRAVAPVVLLDSDFGSLPPVLGEGRRVIANVERVANLFLTKTVYAALLALIVGVARVPFPFLPRHLTIVSSLTIGIPAFFLALAPNAQRARPGFVERVLRFAVPAGTVAAACTIAAYALARSESGVSQTEARTTATITLFLVALWVLAILARPTNPWRAGLVLSMAAAFAVIMAVPGLRDFFALNPPRTELVLSAIGIAAAGGFVIEMGWRITGWVRSHQAAEPGDGEDGEAAAVGAVEAAAPEEAEKADQ